ncbi:MAG: nucleotide-binding protein [Ferrovum sp.]|jgi:hypothetical protein|nr:nucleotide-binding protein [Ferrovum sp.]
MRRTIFYSWQSDLDSVSNRNLIEEALNRSLKAIRQDGTAAIEPVLDRDTSGVPGSPSIAHSIFDKISFADVFVADVSIINKGADGRLTPNPNVLIELGYAVGKLGWDRIVLVQNTEYGSPDDLPFDLRGRRIVTYSYQRGKDKDNKSESRGLLQGRLETALRCALSDSTPISLPAGKRAPIWWGKWKVPGAELGFGGTLFIREVGAVGFLFDLSVYNGSHTGAITAYARIVAPNLAYARVTNGENGEFGEISFRRSTDSDTKSIVIEETASCSAYHGMGASFHGTFVHRPEYLFERGFMNELDLQRFYGLTGQYYDRLRQCMVATGEGENLDSFVADVLWGGVRGLFTVMEGIVIRGERGELWAAFIDDDIVRYFTTQHEWKVRLPKTIEKWREKFNEKEVVYESPVEVIPGNGWA